MRYRKWLSREAGHDQGGKNLRCECFRDSGIGTIGKFRYVSLA